MEIHRISCGNVNCYAIAAASGPFLVDTGRPGDTQAIETELRAKGVQPDRLKLVILTHSHMDHAGRATALKKKYHVPIAMAEGGPGGPVESRGVTGSIILRASKKTLGEVFDTRPDILLRDGQKLHEFGLLGRVIALPGHTPDSIGLLLDGGKLLIAGGMYMNFSGPDLAHIYTDKDELETSHRRLLEMQVQTVYPGRGKEFAFSAVKRK